MNEENYMTDIADEVEQKNRTFFPSLELDVDESIEAVPMEYDRVGLKELDDEEKFIGNPYLSPVESFQIDEDGETVTKYRCNLYIVDHSQELYLQARINLKKEGDIQVGIRKGSVLYDILASIARMEYPNRKFNIIKKANLEEYRSFINDISNCEVQAVEHSFGNGDTTYNGLVFTKLSN